MSLTVTDNDSSLPSPFSLFVREPDADTELIEPERGAPDDELDDVKVPILITCPVPPFIDNAPSPLGSMEGMCGGETQPALPRMTEPPA